MRRIPSRAECSPAARLAAIAVGLVLAGLAGGEALGHAPDPVLSPNFWAKDATLTFRWRAGEEPPSSLQTAIRAAADDSNTTKWSRAANYVYKSAGANPIEYGLDVTCGPNGIACFTRSVPNGFTMGFREHGHRFDWGTLRWCQMFKTPWPNGCFDAENIALDEFGHIEGLDHHVNHADGSDYADAVVQTFSRTKPQEGWNRHGYGTCDVATLQLSYDVPAPTTGIARCLDLATRVVLSASPTSVAVGGSTVLTATVRIGSSTSYGELKDNPLAMRTVTLQRRPLGGTTWTSVGTMASGPTAGSYVTTIFPTSTYEWRASFSPSGSEGVRPSVSAPVTVAIAVSCDGALIASAVLSAPCS